MKSEEIKPGMILCLRTTFDLYKNVRGNEQICLTNFGENIIVLSVVTDEIEFNSLKVLYKNRVGYISWSKFDKELMCEPINNKL